jgi:steroid delta-isomerase-like uncharacterized protein
MTAEENKAIIREFVEEFQGRRNLGAIYDYMSPDFVNHTAAEGAPNSREGVEAFFTAFYNAFPDFHATIIGQYSEGDKVATYKVFHGTHQGDFFGIPPTGKSMEMKVHDILQLRDGKIVGHWGYYDQLGLMQQLGVIPSPQPEEA